MAIVVGVLLIAGANVAGLMLARGVARQREMAIRLALGGTRYRIVRQLVVESLVLAVGGAALGLLLSTWGTALLLGLFVDGESATAVNASPDARVLAFNFALALVTGLAFGLVPAWQTSRPDLAPTLKEQSGGVVSGGSVRLRKALVVAQVALSLLLLIGAGLFVRSLSNLLAQDPGFKTDNLLAFNVEPSLNGYDSDKTKRFATTLLQRLNATSGVTGAGVAIIPILNGGSWNSTMTVEGRAARPGEPVVAFNNLVMPGYFLHAGDSAAAGPRLHRARRVLGPRRRGHATFRVAIANRKFVEQLLRRRRPDWPPRRVRRRSGHAHAHPDRRRRRHVEVHRHPRRRRAAAVLPGSRNRRAAVVCLLRAHGADADGDVRDRAARGARPRPRPADLPVGDHGPARPAVGDQRACHRGPVQCAWRAGVAAGRGRPVRRDGVHGDAADARDRHPDGAGRPGAWRGVALRPRSRRAGGAGLCSWRCRLPGRSDAMSKACCTA